MQCFHFHLLTTCTSKMILLAFSDDDLTLFLVIVKFAQICVWFKRLLRVYHLLQTNLVYWLYIYCLLDACDWVWVLLINSKRFVTVTFFCYIFWQAHLLLVNILEHRAAMHMPIPSGCWTCELINMHGYRYVILYVYNVILGNMSHIPL